jgi:hypothetical protein
MHSAMQYDVPAVLEHGINVGNIGHRSSVK